MKLLHLYYRKVVKKIHVITEENFSSEQKIFIHLEFCVFIGKFVETTKNLQTSYTFFVKPTFFFSSRNKKIDFTLI